MIPYTSFLYFGISLYSLLPDLIFAWFKRLAQVWIVVATGMMLVVQYTNILNTAPDAPAGNELGLVLGYTALQYGVALGFLFIRRRRASRLAFYGALLLALLPLLAGRLAPFWLPSYNLVFLGLSYVTFRSLDVIIGIQDELIQGLPPVQFVLFLLFFPAISSGPVDRYTRFQQDWQHTRSRDEILQDLDGAVHRIFTGFLYKFILAALIQTYWLHAAARGTGFLTVMSYMYAYSFYLFFDFAGYSAFAVGFSYLFGIHTPENFNRPFLARNIRDFWNRWHISLSGWFRDHVYSRFVFAALKGRWFKSKYTASYLGYLLAMGLMGVWHGTAWHFILYGLYHGTLLVLTDWLERQNKKKKWWDEKRWTVRAVQVLVTFQLVCFGLLIFSGRLG